MPNCWRRQTGWPLKNIRRRITIKNDSSKATLGFDKSLPLHPRPKISGIPDQARIVRDAFAVLKIPIFRILKTREVAVEKNKLRAFIVQGGMDVVLLCNRRETAIFEQPDGGGRLSDDGQFDLITGTQSVDVF